VNLIPNAVDVAHFRRPTSRPVDLPEGQVAVYAGSLHESRLDVDLVVEIARSLPALHVVLVGPDSLSPESRCRLVSEPNVHLVGVRPYSSVPAYLQHADVIVVPHLVNEFTESLDPIKAYECVAAGTPTVATPVAGFRGLAGNVEVAAPPAFASAVKAALENEPKHATPSLPSWADRSEDFERILRRVSKSWG
jgi:teichuronic acid biosynthesis glycosyltransferase TuaH